MLYIEVEPGVKIFAVDGGTGKPDVLVSIYEDMENLTNLGENITTRFGLTILKKF